MYQFSEMRKSESEKKVKKSEHVSPISCILRPEFSKSYTKKMLILNRFC